VREVLLRKPAAPAAVRASLEATAH
jgi:hypothetical protein